MSRIRTNLITNRMANGAPTVSNGLVISGVTTATTFVGALTGNVTGNISGGTVAGSTGTFTDDLQIAGDLIHINDTNTRIKFPSNDTITAETGGAERLRINSTGQLLLGAGAVATTKVTQAGSLDLDSGGISLCIGGNENSNGRTNSTNKLNRVVTPHYTNAEEPMAMISGYSTSGASELFYGGGSGLSNAVTTHHFYTAANTTSTTGIERIRIDSTGGVIIGTGNDSSTMSEFGSNTGGLTIDDAGVANTGLRLSHGNDDTYLIQSSNSNFYISQYSTGNMIFGVGASGNERLRITSGGDVSINDGNLVIASGPHGIDFSADSSGTLQALANSFNAEVLHDYEVGTFVPNIQYDTGTNQYTGSVGSGQSVSAAKGEYIRIGDMVWAAGEITLVANRNSTQSPHISIGGMPYNGLHTSQQNSLMTGWGGAAWPKNDSNTSYRLLYSYHNYTTLNFRFTQTINTGGINGFKFHVYYRCPT